MVSIDTGSGGRNKKRDNKKTNEIDDELNSMMLESSLKVVAGIVDEAEVGKLYKLTFRASRGKVAVYTKSVGKIYSNSMNPDSVKPVSVYLMVFSHSEEMMKRVEKICDGFSKVKYDLESAFQPEEREIKCRKLTELITSQKETIRSTRKTLRDYIKGIQ